MSGRRSRTLSIGGVMLQNQVLGRSRSKTGLAKSPARNSFRKIVGGQRDQTLASIRSNCPTLPVADTAASTRERKSNF